MSKEDVEVERSALFKLEDIPKDFKGVKLNEDVRSKLSYGQWSPLLRNVEVEPGVVQDAKLRLVADANKSFKFVADIKQEKLVIGPVIHGHKLTMKEHEDLEKNRVVGPLRLKNDSSEKFFLQVDKDLNTVTINTAEGIGVPERIGNYQLTDRDQNTLANGGRMPARVFETSEGFFMANLSLSADGRGLTYSNIKDLTREQAKELIPKFNVDNTNTLSKIAAATQEAVQTKEVQQKFEHGVPVAPTAAVNGRSNTVSKTVAATEERVRSKEVDQEVKKGVLYTPPKARWEALEADAKPIDIDQKTANQAVSQGSEGVLNINPTAEQIKILKMADDAKSAAREPGLKNQLPLDIPSVSGKDNKVVNGMIEHINKHASHVNKQFAYNVLMSDDISVKAKAETLVAVSLTEKNDAIKLKENVSNMKVLNAKHLGATIDNSKLDKTHKTVLNKALGIQDKKVDKSKGHTDDKSKKRADPKTKKSQRQKGLSKPPRRTT